MLYVYHLCRGYQDTLSQFSFLLTAMNTPYVDLLLNHWPTSPAYPTVDKTCDPTLPSYDAKQCRLNTWQAMVELYQNGTALSIGVANYNETHIQEIIDAGMPLPAVNQVPYHLYNAQSQQGILKFCRSLNITLLSYSPLGIPDWHSYPTGSGELPSNTTLSDPVPGRLTYRADSLLPRSARRTLAGQSCSYRQAEPTN